MVATVREEVEERTRQQQVGQNPQGVGPVLGEQEERRQHTGGCQDQDGAEPRGFVSDTFGRAWPANSVG